MDPNTEPQPLPDSGSPPPSHDFNIEDYTPEEAEQSKTPIKDSNLQRIDEGTLWVPPPPPGDSNLDNIVQKASPDVTKGMRFAKENENLLHTEQVGAQPLAPDDSKPFDAITDELQPPHWAEEKSKAYCNNSFCSEHL
ncbi:hypothetical protein J3E69DRAFT_364756 [Trichoderma sp. SZMC 28015]